MEQVKISRDWSIELELLGKLHQFLPAFCHTKLHNSLFAHPHNKRRDM